MKRVFVLEDDSMRNRLFFDALLGTDFTIALDIDDALKKFQPPYDVIFLDHDLGDRTYVDTKDKNTGSEFLRQRADQFGDAVVVLHSMNRPARESMMHYLLDNGFPASRLGDVPFGPTVLAMARAIDREE